MENFGLETKNPETIPGKIETYLAGILKQIPNAIIVRDFNRWELRRLNRILLEADCLKQLSKSQPESQPEIEIKFSKEEEDVFAKRADDMAATYPAGLCLCFGNFENGPGWNLDYGGEFSYDDPVSFEELEKETKNYIANKL